MNTISPIRLVVADDQPVIMRGLGLILNTDEGVEVVGHAKDGYEVVERAKEHTGHHNHGPADARAEWRCCHQTNHGA